MRALFWNIRGFGARGRRDQLKDLVRSNSIDFVGLVETFKESFSPNDFSAIVGMDRFNWQFLPASGHSGGILIGSNKDIFDFVAFDHGIFWASVVLSHKAQNTLCEFIVVYGPADHSLSPLFLNELSLKIDACNLPMVIGGDFNLLRCPNDKSNDNFSWPLANAFNDFISANAIRELPRGELVIPGPIISQSLLDQCLTESSFVPGGIPCSLGPLFTPNALSVPIIPP